MLTAICLSSAFVFFLGLLVVAASGNAQKAKPADSPSAIVFSTAVQLALVAGMLYVAWAVN